MRRTSKLPLSSASKRLRERPLSLIGGIINDTKGRRAELLVPAKACNELFDVVGLGHPQS